MNAQKFVETYKTKEMKFWKKEGRVTKIKVYQFLNFLTGVINVTKVRIYQTSYLAIKTDNIIELVDIEHLSKKVINYIESKFPNEYGVINRTDILDALVEKSIMYYNDKILNHLPIQDIKLLIDTKSSSEIAFKNGIVKIEKGTHKLTSYVDYENSLLKRQIINRNFIDIKQKCRCVFSKFIWNLSNHSFKRFKVFCTVLGYLMHRYKDPANPKMIILIDQAITELGSSNGGSGKSLMLSALSHIRNLVEVNGKKFQSNQRFAFQRVDLWTDVVLVNDASKTENLENWYNVLADGFVMERKYEKEKYIPYEYSFKVAMTTNHMIRQPEGNSSERRKFEVEVSGFYGKDLTPEEDFGHILFSDWDTKEWNQFDNFMVFCLEYFLQFGLLTPPKINILKRKLISEVGVDLIEFMDEKIQTGVTKFHKKDTYDEFVKGGFVNRKYIPQRNSFTRKLRKYFEYKELKHTEKPSDSKKYFELITDEIIEEITTKTIKNSDVKYILVDTDNKIAQLEKKLKTKLKWQQFAYDLETTSLCVHSCNILGIALCLRPDEAYYIAFDNNRKRTSRVMDLLKPYFENESIEKIGHNLKFDNKVLRKQNINVRGRLHDTMIADYILNPERKKHGLKLLSKLHLNYQQIEFKDVANRKSKKEKTLVNVDPKVVKDYACEDVDQTLKLQQLFLPKINEIELRKVYDLDCNLVHAITSMEYSGIKIDITKLKEIETDIDDELTIISNSLSNYTDCNFKINSQKDLNKLLFEELNLETNIDKGKNGLRSVSSAILKKISPQHEVVDLILNYKSLFKVKSTFIKALQNINPFTGRLHTSINQTVTATGRLSSSNPNLQNIPSRTIGKRLRQCFIASSNNHTLIGADYSNIELRITAIMSRDKQMLLAYNNKIDLHTLTASKVLNLDYRKVNGSQRNIAKSINFGLIYGMTAKGLAQSLTQNTGKKFSAKQCQSFINKYFELYEGVAKFREELIYKATINGYTETLFGRKRPILGINSDDFYKREVAKRLALNTPIQGTAADIIKIAMVNIDQRIKKEKLQSKMVLQVHDELLFDVPNSELEYMKKLVKHEMKNAVHLPIVLEVDLKTGKTWADVH